MKKGIISKLGAGAVVLTLVTASLVGGTFAKYVGSVSGKAEGAIAKFSFTSDNLDQDTPIAIMTGDEKMAPGKSGEIPIKITSDSDVDLNYVITLDTLAGKPENLVFSATKAGTAITIPADATTPVELATGEIKATDKGEKTVNLYWSWDYDGTDTAPTGVTPKVTFNIKAVGTQAEATVES